MLACDIAVRHRLALLWAMPSSPRGASMQSIENLFRVVDKSQLWRSRQPAGAENIQEAERALDKEIVRLHWLTPAELEARKSEHRSPLVAKCVADFLAGQRFALDIFSPEFA